MGIFLGWVGEEGVGVFAFLHIGEKKTWCYAFNLGHSRDKKQIFQAKFPGKQIDAAAAAQQLNSCLLCLSSL